jgi:chaperone required for assembly of F1-ATPase
MQVKQIEIHGRSLKKPANRELIVERARGFRRSLASLRAEYESARAQHEQEVSA